MASVRRQTASCLNWQPSQLTLISASIGVAYHRPLIDSMAQVNSRTSGDFRYRLLSQRTVWLQGESLTVNVIQKRWGWWCTKSMYRSPS
ncbi:hypothetical protein Y032_0145g2470 [Ancylostoma ceylanicum]|nr:hypothetical protein Y032_0145g2470 [Ancylostoma ceylanicum]